MENYQEFTKPRHTVTDKIQSKVLPQRWCSAVLPYICGTDAECWRWWGGGRDMFGDWQDRRYGIWVRLSWAPYYVNWYVDKYSQGAKIIFVWCATIVCINFWPHLHFEYGLGAAVYLRLKALDGKVRTYNTYGNLEPLNLPFRCSV